MPTVTIDDRAVTVADGATILEAVQQLGISLPTLCHHTDLTPVGSCRMCMVRIKGQSQPQPACSTLVRADMKVTSDSEELQAERRMVLELLLSRYSERKSGGADPGRDGGMSTSLASGAMGGKVEKTEFLELVEALGCSIPDNSPRYERDSDDNPFIVVDLNKCILCTRCVRACQEVQGRFVWDVAQRGDEARVVCGNDSSMLDARCESCGACAAYCPTGALDDRMSLGVGPPDRKVRTTCGYCGVGCQFDMNIKDERIVRVTSTEEAPVNGMSLCVKGRYGYDFVHHPDRVLKPRVRKYLLAGRPAAERPADRGPWVDVEWDEALALAGRKLANVLAESGSGALGVLASAKCTNEENYLMQKFARQVLGTNNVDHCARLCHSSTVAGLVMAMGSGAMTNPMADIAENARAIFITGSNTTEQHPVFGAMLRQAALRGTKIVVADPRAIDITEFAELHLRHRPGTDVALINGIMHLAIEHGWTDRTFIEQQCEGYEELAELVTRYTPQMVSEITGVSTDKLRAAAELLCTTSPMATIWSMGITQHTTGVSNVLSLANLQMVLGNMGVRGGGVNPLRGQNNVQGACDMGALPNVFPGYQRVDDAAVVEKFSQAWQLSSGPALDANPGLTVTEMVQAAGDGKLRALYILGEDLAMTEPDTNHARACLAQAEFVVLQEIFSTETAAYADVLLPGASFAEKGGTVTNTERRVQLVQKAIEPLGAARPDWQITCQLADRVLREHSRHAVGTKAAWEYAGPADILGEINQLTPIYGGITHQRVVQGDCLHWPVPDVEHPGTPILHVGQFTRGKGKLHAIDYLPSTELPDREFPLLLTTGRVLYHWHGGEQTRRAEGLATICPEAVIEVSAEDARRYTVENGQCVTLESRRGQLEARVRITNRVSEGVVFGNFHFPSGNANNLTISALDPIAKIPEYKVCAVRFA